MRSQGPAWRARRRQRAVSHWPPRRWEIIGGRHVRELTRAQRIRIAGLIDRDDGAFGVEAEIQAVIDGTESPTRRLHRLLAATKEDA